MEHWVNGESLGRESAMNVQAMNNDAAIPGWPTHPPRLRLTGSDDRPHVETARPVTLIGSRRDCDLFLRNSDVSKVHCAVLNTGDEILAADLGTRAGTYVNGQRITVAVLKDGDEIEIAGESVRVCIEGACEFPTDAYSAETGWPESLTPMLRLITPDRNYDLQSLPAVIGRRHSCQIVLDTPDVSLAHALLFAIRQQPVIFDLGSRSGTYLNTQRVMLARLQAGDCIRIGGVDLSIESVELRAKSLSAVCGDLECDCTTPGSIAPHAPGTNRSLETPANCDDHGDEGVAAFVSVADSDASREPVSRDSSTPSTGGNEADSRPREADLLRRLADLETREERLEAWEKELGRREDLLVKRETDHAAAACRLKQFMESLGEAWPVTALGLGLGPTDEETSASSNSTESGREDDIQPDSSAEPLPGPLVTRALFPIIGKH